jgi:hypothetical protein
VRSVSIAQTLASITGRLVKDKLKMIWPAYVFFWSNRQKQRIFSEVGVSVEIRKGKLLNTNDYNNLLSETTSLQFGLAF